MHKGQIRLVVMHKAQIRLTVILHNSQIRLSKFTPLLTSNSIQLGCLLMEKENENGRVRV